MNAFEDLNKLSNLELQKVINQITDNILLATVLKSAEEVVKNKFFSAMSPARNELVRESFSNISVSLTEITSAQSKIIGIANKIL